MKKLIIGFVLFLTGCSSLHYAPAPTTVLDSSKVVRASGVLNPYGLAFESVSVFDGEGVRVVVLTALGVKLLDMYVTPARTTVYFVQPALPGRVQKAFSRWAKNYLMYPCPAENFNIKDARVRGTFEGERTSICHF